MSIIVATNLEKRYGDQLVFGDLGLRVEWGDRIGLVGPNGSGKSSLIRIIAGQDDMYAGDLYRSQGLTIGCLEQEPLGADRRTVRNLLDAAFADLHRMATRLEELTEKLARPAADADHRRWLEEYGRLQAEYEAQGGYDIGRSVEEVLRHLWIAESAWDRPVSSLSGGQRTRVHLGFLLLSRPQLLLLDEPTNHLDRASMPWLAQTLQAWEGSVVMVSHDGRFLDRVVTAIWEMDRHRLDHYRGDYSHYQAQRAERRERQSREWQAQQEYVARTEDFIRRFKAGQRSREARGRETRMKRHLARHGVDRPQQDRELHLSFPSTYRSGDIVLRTAGLEVGYGADAPVLRVPDLEIRRRAKVAILGPNGSGKSTLLRTIVGQLEPIRGELELGTNVRIGYFAQHQVRDDYTTLDASKSPFDLIQDERPWKDGEVRNYLGRFQLTGEDVFRPLSTLSGGQKSRLMFALLAMRDTNFLVLDEPTSHFDSLDALRDSLARYEGTLLLVTHDRELVNALANQLWLVIPAADGAPSQLVIRRDETTRIDQVSEDAGRDEVASPAPATAESNAPATAQRGESKSNRSRISRLEEEINALEHRIGMVLDRLTEASAKGAGDEIRKLRKVHRFLQEQSERRWDEWERLQIEQERQAPAGSSD